MNLGYTTPGVDPGVAFPNTATLSSVNAPLEIVIGGQAVDVINQVGWPGQVNTYRVDFRVPQGTGSGSVAIQLRASGIAGPAVNLPAQ